MFSWLPVLPGGDGSSCCGFTGCLAFELPLFGVVFWATGFGIPARQFVYPTNKQPKTQVLYEDALGPRVCRDRSSQQSSRQAHPPSGSPNQSKAVPQAFRRYQYCCVGGFEVQIVSHQICRPRSGTSCVSRRCCRRPKTRYKGTKVRTGKKRGSEGSTLVRKAFKAHQSGTERRERLPDLRPGGQRLMRLGRSIIHHPPFTFHLPTIDHRSFSTQSRSRSQSRPRSRQTNLSALSQIRTATLNHMLFVTWKIQLAVIAT